jgi:hypothetical protein
VDYREARFAPVPAGRLVLVLGMFAVVVVEVGKLVLVGE